MRLPRKLTAAVVMAAAISMAVLPTAAWASQQAARWVAFGNNNWGIINWTTNTDFVTTEEIQVQNNNELQDAFTMQICSVANCPTWGPLQIGRGDQWFEIDTINEPFGVPGYIVTYTICEYAVGCTSAQLNPWGRN